MQQTKHVASGNVEHQRSVDAMLDETCSGFTRWLSLRVRFPLSGRRLQDQARHSFVYQSSESRQLVRRRRRSWKLEKRPFDSRIQARNAGLLPPGPPRFIAGIHHRAVPILTNHSGAMQIRSQLCLQKKETRILCAWASSSEERAMMDSNQSDSRIPHC